jgi:DNA replication and repair protein RecF
MDVWEEMMAAAGSVVYEKRRLFIQEFIPLFQTFYARISGGRERVDLAYTSHAQRGDLRQLIRDSRPKDRIMGYSLHGIHKDDLLMQLGDFPIKREGSQGQNKTYLVALKLAQFDFLHRAGSGTTPLLLLDDIFDKLDAERVEQIVKLVASDRFGQIFITDTNRDHLDSILRKLEGDYRVFGVEKGQVEPWQPEGGER